MPQNTENYNLLEEDWIPVLRTNGRAERVGIRTALLEAGSIRQIAASNPIDNVALLRLLLAVLQWCKPDPTPDELEVFRSKDLRGVPPEWLTKLGTPDPPNPLFNLLGKAHRFMQAPPDSDKERPVADLFHELPGGTNVAHFRHIRDYREGACPACVAVGLARLPVAITGKGASKRAGINGDPPLYFVPFGRTLRKTFHLNWPFDSHPVTRPVGQAIPRRIRQGSQSVYWKVSPGLQDSSGSTISPCCRRLHGVR
jgi:CRISPR system Cascade subunit CasA